MMLLEGQFDKSFLTSDNSQLVATETQKNTLYVMAKKYPIEPIEEWGQLVAKDFMSRFAHIEAINFEIEEVGWERMKIFGQEHNHAFKKNTTGKHPRKI